MMLKHTITTWFIFLLFGTSQLEKRFKRNIQISNLDDGNLICEDECEETTNCSPRVQVIAQNPSNMSKIFGRMVKIHQPGRLHLLCYLEDSTDGNSMKRWISQTFLSSVSNAVNETSSLDIQMSKEDVDVESLIVGDVTSMDNIIKEPEIQMFKQDAIPEQYVISCTITFFIIESQELQLFRVNDKESKRQIPLDPKSISALFSDDGNSISMTYRFAFHYTEKYFNNSFECRSVDTFSKDYKSKSTRPILPEVPCLQNLRIEQKSDFELTSRANRNYEDSNGYLYCSCPGAYPKPQFHWRDAAGRVRSGRSLKFIDYLYQPYCCVAKQNLKNGTHELEACVNDRDKRIISSVSWSDIKNKRVYSIDNLYALRHEFDGSSQLMSVNCEARHTDNETWILIQRRFNGNENFARSWNEYKNGFGDLNGEFWLGNEKLYQLTSIANMKIRFDLWDKDDNYAYAEYSSFSVSDEKDQYRLTIMGYSGDAGDSMGYHNKMQFSTNDRDNDKSSTSCSLNYGGKGGWWFYFCHHANLNGKYLSPGTNDGNGIEWNGFYDYRSLKKVAMKIAYT